MSNIQMIPVEVFPKAKQLNNASVLGQQNSWEDSKTNTVTRYYRKRMGLYQDFSMYVNHC
eukprot:2694362-Amphidinium_carterae.1